MKRLQFKEIRDFDKLIGCNDNHSNNLCGHFRKMQELKQYRDEIDAIDRQIAELLGKRFRIAEKVVEIKRHHNIPVRIEKRIKEVLDHAQKNEETHQLPPKLGYFLWREIIEATCWHEETILGMRQDNAEEEN